MKTSYPYSESRNSLELQFPTLAIIDVSDCPLVLTDIS
jgi:hypothetical protein